MTAMSRKSRIIEMHCFEGKTRSEIAAELSLSHGYVSKVLKDNGSGVETERKILFPAVKEWMASEKITFDAIAKKSGYSRSYVYNSLSGGTLNKYIIDTILQMSGMTYEEAFKE